MTMSDPTPPAANEELSILEDGRNILGQDFDFTDFMHEIANDLDWEIRNNMNFSAAVEDRNTILKKMILDDPPVATSFPSVPLKLEHDEEKASKDHCSSASISSSPTPSLTSSNPDESMETASSDGHGNDEADLNCKEARQKRIEIMVLRHLGRYYARTRKQRQSQSVTTSPSIDVLSKEQAKNAASDAVNSMIDGVYVHEQDSEEVARIAKFLLKSQTTPMMKQKKINLDHSISKKICATPDCAPSSNVKVMTDSTKRHVTKVKKDRKKAMTEPDSSAPLSLPLSPVSDMDLPSGDDAESRRQRRLIRNRMSAQLHRERKKNTLEFLRKENEGLSNVLKTAQQQVDKLKHMTYKYQDDFDQIRSHFGDEMIDSILSNSHAMPPLVKSSDTPPSSPPHLVNSSESDLSEDDDSSESSSSSPPCPILSRKRNDHNNINVDKPNKKTRGNTMLFLTSSLAFCTFIGCMVPFNTLNINSNNPIVVLPQHNQNEWGGYSSPTSTPMRRRLSEEDFDDDYESSNKNKDYVLSPIESYPSLWTVNHALQGSSPWTYQNFHQLFDIASIPNRSSLSSINAFTTMFMNKNRAQEPKQEQEDLSDGTNNSRSGLRGKSSDKQNRGDNSEITVPYDSQKTSSGIGSSFLFCPSAYASLSPGFLELTNLADSESSMWENKEKERIREVRRSNINDDSSSTALVPSMVAEQLRQYRHSQEEEQFQNQQFSSSYFKGSPVIKPILGGDDPYMMILLPSSAFTDDAQDIDSPTTWIELECQVRSARIVDGVDFVETTEEEEDFIL